MRSKLCIFYSRLKKYYQKKEKVCQTWQWTGYDRNCNSHYWNHVYFICDVQRVSTEFIKQISQTWHLEKSYLGIWLLDLFKKVMSKFIFLILHHVRCIYRTIKYIKAENWHALSHEKYFYNTTYLFWMRKKWFFRPFLLILVKYVFCRNETFLDFIQLLKYSKNSFPRRPNSLKGYLHYKMITSQNVPSEARVKNFFVS